MNSVVTITNSLFFTSSIQSIRSMRLLLLIGFSLISLCCASQIDSISLAKSDKVIPTKFLQPSNTFSKKRFALVSATESILATSTLLALNQLWYKNYPQTSFHTFNDNSEWLQMDKCGHVITAYTVGKYGLRLLEWGGVSKKKAIWYGGLTGFAYLGVVEVFDGFSEGWGFSAADLTANVIGVVVLISQEYLWKEQSIGLKFSFHKTPYPSYRPTLLGRNWQEQVLKDYNGQTYWISLNIASFLKKQSKFPKFVNIALGYGANGMTGANSNPLLYNSIGNSITFERSRQYYLSLDIDLTKVKTKSSILKSIFETIGFLKFPAPGIQFNNNHFSGSWLMY